MPILIRNYTTPEVFYPFGGAEGDTISPAVFGGSSPAIQLLSPFLFFGRAYQQIYVNNFGHLTFNQPLSASAAYSFPANRSRDIIAGLWTDLDNRVKGVVSYHQYTSGNVLTRATQDINTHFPNLNFTASWVFVATWSKVTYYIIDKAGYDTINSTHYFVIPGSTDGFSISNLRNTSNVNVPGRWAFRVNGRPTLNILKIN
ncbi:Alpha-tectorin [Labeo rohita]|uniref:Alpha-tectorin n=1 Tax=Labeo rohita TaxID=84645 RepID=A0ABQ8M5U1_LABRO|nr:Alpha-tectorin [Labeo rohita]